MRTLAGDQDERMQSLAGKAQAGLAPDAEDRAEMGERERACPFHGMLSRRPVRRIFARGTRMARSIFAEGNDEALPPALDEHAGEGGEGNGEQDAEKRRPRPAGSRPPRCRPGPPRAP